MRAYPTIWDSILGVPDFRKHPHITVGSSNCVTVAGLRSFEAYEAPFFKGSRDHKVAALDWGLGFRVFGLGFRVWGLGFNGLGYTVLLSIPIQDRPGQEVRLRQRLLDTDKLVF